MRFIGTCCTRRWFCSADRALGNLDVDKRGLDAHNHPAFYRQIGKDPEQLTTAAIALLETNFIWQGPRCARR